MPDPIAPTLQRLKRIPPPLWLFAFSLLLFWPALGGGFVMDDWPVVKENSKITRASDIPAYFSSGVWSNTDLAEQAGLSGNTLYRPLFLLTLNVAHQLWGDNPLGYHLLNLLLHGLNVVLVYYLLLGLPARGAARNTGALLGAAVFAAHPVHVESIAWVAGITDPLVSMLLLASLLLYRRAGAQQSPLAAAGALGCYALALLSKEVAIFFPLLLLAHDLLTGTRPRWTRYLPYAVLFALYFLLRAVALGDGADVARMDFNQWPLLFEFLTRYIQLLFVPWPLEYYYDAPATSLFSLITGGGLLLAALAGATLAWRRGQRLPAFALAWLLVTLAPALPIALFAEPVFAIRVLYLPSVALALIVAWLFDQRLQRGRAIATAGIGAFIVVAIPLTIAEIADWRDDITFYSLAANTSPASYKPLVGLADAFERDDQPGPAIDASLRAAARAPDSRTRLDLRERAARLLGQNGDTEGSAAIYREIVTEDPQRSSAWVGLGNNAFAQRELARAQEYYRRALQADAGNAEAAYNLSLVLRNLRSR